MNTVLLAYLVCLAQNQAAGDVPGPAPVPAPAPAPAAAAPAVAAPILPADLALQPVYGPLLTVWPAHQLALMEAGQTMVTSDPRVGQVAQLLSQLTGEYAEDAPRIAELTIRVCQEIRAANRPASPLEMLNGARAWRPRAAARPGVPRQYEQFEALYRQYRVKGGKDHNETMDLILKEKGR